MLVTLKPHHFMDLICDMAANKGRFDYISPFENDFHIYGNLMSAGEIDSVIFTCDKDDICTPCKKLVDGICNVIFSEEIAEQHGTERQHEYNIKLDKEFENALPDVFMFGIEKNIDDVYALLKAKLTPGIILLNWNRENRVSLTFRGLDMVIQARKGKK